MQTINAGVCAAVNMFLTMIYICIAMKKAETRNASFLKSSKFRDDSEVQYWPTKSKQGVISTGW